ncbi:helix-turn-helix domain-containing protein [Streptomyces sp. NPDC102264]|uniref:helix-turn-helix domain-containing protein n=1 Tax=Streptomyces sp. NPDC102264 TaxID=3366149 RepID=UPI003828D4E2
MSETGKSLKEIRKRRGLTQSELSTASGVSLSIIRKLEQGERASARLETLRKLAATLRVPTMRLSSGPNEEGPIVGTAARWEAVRHAVERPPRAPELDDEAPTVAGVRRAFAKAEPLFQKNQYSQLAVVLPPLLRDADALGDEGRAIRVRLLQLAGLLMVQTRQFDTAEVALSRALDDAADRLEGAATVNTQCWLLLRQGRLETALDLAVTWADETEPRMSRATPGELGAWGLMLLKVTAAAVRNSQPGQAADALRLATAAAVALGRESKSETDAIRAFGPTTVHLKRTENAGVVDRPDVVLSLAKRVPASSMPSSSNRNRYELGIADALARTGRCADGFETLAGIQRSAPEWLPNQTYARTVLRRIVEGRRTLTPEMRQMAADIHLEI